MPLRRVALAIIAIGYLPVGLWATFAPMSFYKDFPGLGHHWVAVDGPYNHHLVTDVGGLNLALGAIAVIAFISLTPILIRATAVGALLYEVPHALYHGQHLDPFGSTDKVLVMGSFALVIVMALALLVFDRR